MMINRSILRISQFPFVLLALLLLSSIALAQGERGAITGVVKDASGAVAPNVQVMITNKATGVETRAVTTDAGVYRANYISPGTYTITSSLSGFKTAIADNVEVRVAQVVTVDFTLELGEVTERITVSAETPLLESSTSEIGTDTTDKEFHTWPILVDDGLRQLQNFIFTSMPGTEGGTFEGSINGGQAYSHEILIEGISIGRYDLTGGSNNEFSPSVDAAAEFKLQTGTLSAQYGATQTAITNFGMKSGSNDYHGSVYWFHRNKSLRARSWSENAFGIDRKQPLLENSYGATAGGPIKKDRTHFFFSFEGDRRNEQAFQAENGSLPIPAFKTGDFSSLFDPSFTGDSRSGTILGQDALGRDVRFGQIYDPLSARQLPDGTWIRDPFPGNIIPADGFSSVARSILEQADTPDPAFAGFRFNHPRVSSCCPNFKLDIISVKLDHVLTANHKIAGFFTYSDRVRDNHGSDGFVPIPGPASSVWQRQATPGRIFRFSEDWTINPTTLNHFAFGFNRFGNVNGPADTVRGQDWASKLGLTGVGAGTFPEITFAGANPTLTGGYPRLGVSFAGDAPVQSFILADDLTFIRGQHNFRVGTEIRRYHANDRNLFTAGTYAFRSELTSQPDFVSGTGFAYASFLLGAVNNSGLGIPATFPGQRVWYNAFYFQDDWKMRPNFTLNYGIRWEIPGVLTEVADRMSGLDPGEPNPGADGFPGALVFLGDCPQCKGGRSFQKPYYREFGPRLGFAWNPTPKIVVRGGYGINYSAPIGNGFGFPYSAGFNGSNPVTRSSARFGQDPVLYWDDGYPAFTGSLPNYDPAQQNDATIAFLDAESTRQPYVQNWNLGVQYELPWNTVLEANYIGNKGTRLNNNFFRGLDWASWGLNQLDPRHLALGDTLLDDIDAHPEIPKPYPSFAGSVAQALRPFPQYYNVVTTKFNEASSSYHSLQVTATKRTATGLSFLAAYTFSKSLATADSSGVGLYGVYGQNFYNRAADKSVTAFHRPHHLKVSWLYDLPFGDGRRWLNQGGVLSKVAGGWTVSAIHNYVSGDPLNILASAYNFNSYLFNPPGWRADVLLGKDQQKLGGVGRPDSENGTPYLNPAAFAQPPGTDNGVGLRLGNASRFLPNIRGPAVYSEDLSIIKRTPLKFREAASFEFRADISNLFNRAGTGNPRVDVSDPSTFGRIFGNRFGPRQFQLGLRVTF